MIILTAMLSILPWTAGYARVLTLQQCRDSALANSIDMKMAEQKITIAGYDRKIALANYFPNISANATYQFNSRNLILLDKNNLEDYFDFAPHLKKLFEAGSLTIQDLADILRTQLLAKHGGIWCDATVFITHNDFLSGLRNNFFYSGSYTPNWLFTKGKWTSFFIAAGRGNPLVSALSEAFTYYFQFHDHHFCYFQFDYTWLYLYSHFAWAKQLIDSVNQDNKNIFYLSYNWNKPYNETEYNKAMMENEIQKLNWKSNKVPELDSAEETNGIHFLSRK